MKKQIIIALAFSISAFSFAQKKELKLVEKAIKSGNFTEAKTALKQAKGVMSLMDDKQKNKYYFLQAQALYAKGKGSITDMDTALESFKKVNGEYASEITTMKQDIANSLLKKANDAYNGQDFSNASTYFEKSYRVKETDTLFLYYAAATAVNIPKYDRALTLYEELMDLGYTGIETQYYATNKETGEEEIFDKSTRDLYVNAKSHIKPGERKTKSKKPEIVKNIAFIYVNNGDKEKALNAVKTARADNPDDFNLVLSEANLYYEMGDTEKFKELLKKATEMDPDNAELQYNLGVISADSDNPEEARAYYEKAIELNPDYVNAYINISALVLAKEEPLINEMNGLGTSNADNKRYDELRGQRQDLYKEAVPYLTKAFEIDSKNVSAAKTLMNIYSILGETDKYKNLKEIVATLEAGN